MSAAGLVAGRGPAAPLVPLLLGCATSELEACVQPPVDAGADG